MNAVFLAVHQNSKNQGFGQKVDIELHVKAGQVSFYFGILPRLEELV